MTIDLEKARRAIADYYERTSDEQFVEDVTKFAPEIAKDIPFTGPRAIHFEEGMPQAIDIDTPQIGNSSVAYEYISSPTIRAICSGLSLSRLAWGENFPIALQINEAAELSSLDSDFGAQRKSYIQVSALNVYSPFNWVSNRGELANLYIAMSFEEKQLSSLNLYRFRQKSYSQHNFLYFEYIVKYIYRSLLKNG